MDLQTFNLSVVYGLNNRYGYDMVAGRRGATCRTVIRKHRSM